jgi:predicted TIM-barrel fold metal-dependent hydrolase
MRIVALEEHFASKDLIARIPAEATSARGWPPSKPGEGVSFFPEAIYDLGAERLRAMDEGGVSTAVLSVGGPGADLLENAQGIEFARAYNDRLAEAVREHPDRFGGFAHLPMQAPEAAADELERAVRELGFVGAMIDGATIDRDGTALFLDDPRFEPILARAEALDVPIYIHPALPPKAVADTYYQRLPGITGFQLSIAGWGWHSETAIHVLRLVLSGALDRHPKLKLIVGHMGEMLPMMMARMDDVFTRSTKDLLTRTISQTLTDQLSITISGFFSLPPLLTALLAFGADRILFSVDYPFSPNTRATQFLRSLPISSEDREKIAHGNAVRLLKLRTGS